MTAPSSTPVTRYEWLRGLFLFCVVGCFAFLGLRRGTRPLHGHDHEDIFDIGAETVVFAPGLSRFLAALGSYVV